MKRALASLLFCFLIGGTSAAAPATTLFIERPWARATPPGAVVAAAYATITNRGPADRLLRVTSPASAQIEIHRSTQVEDRMQMRPVAALDVPTGGTVTFGPNGLHLMLVDLKQPLQAGSRLSLTFWFEKAGPIAIQAEVMSIGSTLAPGEDASHHAHH